MPYEFIDREECIGDSLFKINNNSLNFDNRITNLSSSFVASSQSLTSQIYSPGSILKASFHGFSESSARSGDLRNYTTVNNGIITIISSRANSRFLVTVNGQGYTAPGQSGTNIGIQRIIGGNTTRLLGIDGNSGDSWMGTSNGYTGAFSITRSYLDSPGVPSGTVIYYYLLHGHWSAGTGYINYPGYTGQSSIVVYEMV
jgi:hypothetical protein